MKSKGRPTDGPYTPSPGIARSQTVPPCGSVARALNDVFGTIVKRLEFDPLASGLVREQDGQQVLEINRDMVEATLQV
jgi:hypothetical protein